ncbi:hypothetical protein F511_37597 [Dorcoceras hygrometricum]|uniref:Uncharacterized protein n=1 Tax=Dorcoceras hygrometricum TaxID=472368 RepID=A0A2Z7CBN6_9LAMI|nr:hypothetical protein F511_37597 [Dorcoceras hygrometricum]
MLFPLHGVPDRKSALIPIVGIEKSGEVFMSSATTHDSSHTAKDTEPRSCVHLKYGLNEKQHATSNHIVPKLVPARSHAIWSVKSRAAIAHVLERF